MFVTGPDVVKEVLNEDITMDGLGGGNVHAEKSGVAHFVYEDEEHAIISVRKLLSYLPLNNFDALPVSHDVSHYEGRQEYLNKIIPDD